MFFKDYFISVADIIAAKYQSFRTATNNPSDKGELCEIFMKDFLLESVGDSFKVYRGGKVINSYGIKSRQLDIVICSKKSLKIFGDKGIYATETVFGCISVTSTLTKKKLIQCCKEFASIPKQGHFTAEKFLSKEFQENSLKVWKFLAPYKCVFAYKGALKPGWIDEIISLSKTYDIPTQFLPDLIIVNKIGYAQKKPDENGKVQYVFILFSQEPNYGLPYGKLLYHLNTFSWEEFYLHPEFSHYFNKDAGV